MWIRIQFSQSTSPSVNVYVFVFVVFFMCTCLCVCVYACMFTFSPTTTPHHSRCHYFSCAVFFFVHQFNAVYESHSFVLYSVFQHIDTEYQQTGRYKHVRTHSHPFTHSRSFIHTYVHSNAHSLIHSLTRAHTCLLALSCSASLRPVHSDVCARSLRLSLARFLLHTHTDRIHIRTPHK